MRKVALFLLAFLMVALTGCDLTDSDDFYPTPSNMAGVYNLTKMTVTQAGATITRVPPEISGAIKLTSAGTYSMDYTIPGDHITRSGTYTISEPEHLDPLDPDRSEGGDVLGERPLDREDADPHHMAPRERARRDVRLGASGRVT